MDDIWKDSVCAACGKAECFGECPEYEPFIQAHYEMKRQESLLDKDVSDVVLDEIVQELERIVNANHTRRSNKNP